MINKKNFDNLEITRRERKKKESKARILKAARTFFQEKDYYSTSIEEIAEAADVSKGTFFNYFPTKESLLNGIAEEEIEDIKLIINSDLEEIDSPIEKIRAIMNFLFVDTVPFLRLTKLVLQATTLKADQLPFPVTELKGLLYELIKEAQQKDEIQKDLDSDDIATSITGIYFAGFFKWIELGSDSILKGEMEFDSILDLLFKGIVGKNYKAQ